MNWLYRTWKFTKASSLSASLFTMVMAPVAQGAAAAKAQTPVKVVIDYSKYKWTVDRKVAQDFLKFTGLSSKPKMTVGEYYEKMRPYYPATLRRELDQWVSLNRNELMPELAVSTYKDAEGKEQIRFLISKAGQSVAASFNPGSKDNYIKFNNVSLAKTDMLYYEQGIRKIGTEDKMANKQLLSSPRINRLKAPIRLSYEEYKRLKPLQRAEYMIRLRKLVESSEQVYKTYYGSQALNQFKQDFFVKYLLGLENAYAARGADPKIGDPCLVSGYISVYGENKSCGGPYTGRKSLIEEMEKYGGGRCRNGSISCNPLLYGYTSSGNAFCVKNQRSEIYEATSKNCANASPLKTPEDKKRIIESFMKSKGQAVDLKFDGEGKVSIEQFNLVKDYLSELNNYVDRAVNLCITEPLSAIQAKRTEQMTACRAIALRKINLDFADIVAQPAGLDCNAIKPGSVPDETGKACVCPPNTREEKSKDGESDVLSCVPVEAQAFAAEEPKKECNTDEKKDESTGECVALCGWWCRNSAWVIGGGALLALGGLFWWLNKKDDNNNQQASQTPVDPCAPTSNPPAAVCAPPPAPPAPPPPVQPPPILTPTPAPVPVTSPSPIPAPIPTTTIENTGGGNGAAGATGSAR